MERTLISQGGGGFTVYLPKQWADKKGLKPGDKVSISERENALIIEARNHQKKEITLYLEDESKQNLLHLLTHVYRKGFDTITLTNLDAKNMQQVKNITKELLLGFEVTQQEGKQCTLENISEPTEGKYDAMMHRAFMIVKETVRYVLEDTKHGTYSASKNIEDLRSQHDRIIIFCKRLLSKETGARDSITQWELLSFLMYIQHAAYYLYRYCEENKMKLSGAAADLLATYDEYFSTLAEAYWKRNLSRANVHFTRGKQHYTACTKLIEQTKGTQSVALSHMQELFRLTGLTGSAVLSTCLEEAILVNEPKFVK